MGASELKYNGTEIAIIGMVGRFPGAMDVDSYWKNLINAVESISFLTRDELIKQRVDKNIIDKDNFVNSQGGQVDGKDLFDASFFGYTPSEAQIMDPNLRLLHEYVWKAIEDAGYAADVNNTIIGLYIGATTNLHWLMSAYSSDINVPTPNMFYNTDFFATRVSHKLNLTGPSLNIQSACSTSMVAIHSACRALLTADCQIAMAGGVDIRTMKELGYLYEQGMVISRDGHCRAFDNDASGTVPGNGIGVVALKRLKDAINDRDNIYAIIKSTAINNDGSNKIGYVAPSVEGQVKVIQKALKNAKISPEDLSYIEAHGTGTELGDPIEIKALTQAFSTHKKQYCGIGSVKTNIGHLGNAAGVAGIIKTALILKNKQVPPSLNFKKPNAKIGFEKTPFFVNTELLNLESNGDPLYAGVSSLGIGGTNSHAVLESFINKEEPSKPKEFKLIILSTKKKELLKNSSEELLEFLNNNKDQELADIAYTLQIGRKEFANRQMFVCSSNQEAIDILSSEQNGNIHSAFSVKERSNIVFMFPGQGSQYDDMSFRLYKQEALFRNEMDKCLAFLKDSLKEKLLNVLVNANVGNTVDIDYTEITQPLLFIFEYSLAQLMIKLGVKPIAMIGHSIGEYVAACLSGVLSLDDALNIVSLRGELMQKMEPGVMLSISSPANELSEIISASTSLAAINSPDSCVLSGVSASIELVERWLDKKGIAYRRLHTSHAFHSSMMDPMLNEFEQRLKSVQIDKPKIPFISNVTGTWITTEQACNPAYWTEQLRRSVLFSKGITEIMKIEDCALIEVGPGNTLSTFVKQHENGNNKQKIFNLVKHAKDKTPNYKYFISKLGQLWLAGVNIDWKKYYINEKRFRLSLPTYPFERTSFWIEDNKKENISYKSILNTNKVLDEKENYYIPTWKRSIDHLTKNDFSSWEGLMIISDNDGITENLIAKAGIEGKVVVLGCSNTFEKIDDCFYKINHSEENDYLKVFQDLMAKNKMPQKILHLLNLNISTSNSSKNEIESGYYDLLSLTKSLSSIGYNNEIEILVATSNLFEINGNEKVCSDKSLILGAIKTIPIEFPNIKCGLLEFSTIKEPVDLDYYSELLIKEMTVFVKDEVVSYRDSKRWIQIFDQVSLSENGENSSKLKNKGVYLITGGFGGIGLAIAKFLASNYKAKLVLVSRSVVVSKSNTENNKYIHNIDELENLGAEVLVFQGDVSDLKSMKECRNLALEKFETINGIIHTAGVSDSGLISLRNKKQSEDVFAAKVYGTKIIEKVFGELEIDFYFLCSSISAIISASGQVAYCASNNFLDIFATANTTNNIQFVTSVSWCSWKEDGMAFRASKTNRNINLDNGISNDRGIEIFCKVLNSNLSQVVIAPSEFEGNYKNDNNSSNASDKNADKKVLNTILLDRPDIYTNYVSPETQLQIELADIWQQIFGINKVGIDDDFFELGGDSLKGLNLKSVIQKNLNIDLSLKELFEHSTIRELSKNMKDIDSIQYEDVQLSEKKEFYPLSSAQKRIYVLQKLYPDSTAYNLVDFIHLNVDVDVQKLREIVEKLIKRHAGFRTSFSIIGNEPFQIIHDNVNIEILLYKAGNDSDIKKVKRQFVRPYNFEEAPLIRVGLLQKDDNSSVLMIDIHHIIADGMSIDILKEEFLLLFSKNQLPVIKLRYTDFSETEHKKLRSNNIEKKYWLSQIGKGNQYLNLPVDKEKPKVFNFNGGVTTFDIPEELTLKIKEIVQKEKTTLFTVMLSVFKVFLFKICNQETIVVGTPKTGRNSRETQKIIGMFANTVVLKSIVNEEQTFIQLLTEIKNRCLQAFENSNYQFEDLVQELKLGNDLQSNPLFNVSYFFENKIDTQDSETEFSNQVLYFEGSEKVTSKYDLSLHGRDLGYKLNLSFNYYSEIFEKSTIEKFVVLFKNLVYTIASSPINKLKDFKLIERKEINEDLLLGGLTDFDF